MWPQVTNADWNPERLLYILWMGQTAGELRLAVFKTVDRISTNDSVEIVNTDEVPIEKTY